MILQGKLHTGKYIVYSIYAVHTHITLNAQGLVQTCNPKLTSRTDEVAHVEVHDDLEEAELSKDRMYDRVAEVQEIMRISNHQSFRTLDEQLECKLKTLSQ